MPGTPEQPQGGNPPESPSKDIPGGDFIGEAKNFIKNPLGIIGLFIVLVYAVAGIVTGITMKNGMDKHHPMTWFIVLFPVLILGVFTYLVIAHHLKLYGPGDFTDQDKWLKLQDIIYSLDKEHQPINASLRASNTPDTRQEKLDAAKAIVNSALRDRLNRAANSK